MPVDGPRIWSASRSRLYPRPSGNSKPQLPEGGRHALCGVAWRRSCFNAAESAAADGLAGDDAEPGFNLIDPGRADGGEVKLDVRIILQPGHHLRGSVGGEVVQDHMNLFARVTFHGFLEEGQEVVTVAGGLALTEDLSGADV